MAKELVPAIEPPRVGAQEPFHAGDQVGLGRLDHQMKMVGHQAPGLEVPAGLLTGLAQGLQEEFAVLIVLEDRLAPVAPIHDMVDRTRILNSQLSGHAQAKQLDQPSSILDY